MVYFLSELQLGSLGHEFILHRLQNGGGLSRSVFNIRQDRVIKVFVVSDECIDRPIENFDHSGLENIEATGRWIAGHNLACRIQTQGTTLIEDPWLDYIKTDAISGLNFISSGVGSLAIRNGALDLGRISKSVPSFEFSIFLCDNRLDIKEGLIGDASNLNYIAQAVDIVLLSAFDREGFVIAALTHNN